MKVLSYCGREALRAKLVTAYKSLSPDDKAVLQLMSVFYEPVSRTNMMTALSHAQIRMGNGKAFNSDECRLLLARLREKGLVQGEANAPPGCHELIVEVATRDALREGRFEQLAAAADTADRVEAKNWDYYYFRSFPQAMRVFRLLLYRHNTKALWRVLEKAFRTYAWECQQQHPLIRVCDNPFDAQWFGTLPFEIAEPALWTILSAAFEQLAPAEEAFTFLQQTWSRFKEDHLRQSYRALLGDQLIWRGQFVEAADLARGADTIDAVADGALLALLKGDFESALNGYEEALKQIRQATGKRKARFLGHDGIFYVLALIRTRDSAQLQRAQEYLIAQIRDNSAPHKPAFAALFDLVTSYLGTRPNAHSTSFFLTGHENFHPFDTLVRALVLHWMDSAITEQWPKTLKIQEVNAAESGYHWLAAEMATLIGRLTPGAVKPVPQADEFYERTGTCPLVGLIRRQEAWERSLDALEHIAETGKAEPPGASVCRLAWSIQLHNSTWHIEAREVKRLQSGQWTKGKVVSLKRLGTQREQLSYLTPQDIAVCSLITLESERSSYYGSRTYYALPPRAILALAGHPIVSWAEGGRVEIVRGDPELRVIRKGKYVIIELAPPLDPDRDVAVVRETSAQIKVIECGAAHRRMAAIIQTGLRVPVEHRERVLEALSRVASLITVHSDIGGGLENVPEVPADARPHVLLLPDAEGLRVRILVQPLAQGGAYYRPGAGGETVMAEAGGKRVQTRRNLKVEKELAAQALAACPVLERALECDGEWVLEDPEECLELLEELQDLGEAALVEWPQGEKMRVSHRAAFVNLQIKVSQGRNWFEATGQLRLDENRVLDMRQLLELLDQAPGRFVPLGDGQFLSLTREFRKRLDEFRAMSEEHGKGVRFHPLAAPAVEDLLDGAGSFKADTAWKELIERFREAQTFTPEVPSTLRATLRDYQTEGYQWLARLARWGAGACLADDMGLGKTVQALTLMLSHASEGPALVVAPTSVCMNWIEEAQRFAPTLNPLMFGAGDRQASLDALKPFDLLVCSYGLLHQAEEKLTAVRWRVAVLDEAQAIKNVATRRSQAAMNLQADFRLITTGTPIENHLGELWNLFRFINPGLLGSLEQFNQRFATPIEKRQDREARTRLKKIIQPFILRRVKEQVLEELPSRTEILLHIEFSAEEAAFYEALRQQAVERIAQTKGTPGQKHLQILAEIMRLRRACCNAQLVTPDVAIPSAKLGVFLDLVVELIENRHKALVFSQFVGHLTILRKELDARGVTYQYLDGSTTPRDRKTRVDAFQAGQGDLFLISLKAGGLGLNLTAADYVIHMDPWWNPAVEDQASDRAHRIGQYRPVTIYRLVTKDTIESKIVELHRHKRDLADSLLEGSEMTGKMSADELLALLQQGREEDER